MGRSDKPGLPEAPVGRWGPGGFSELADPLEVDRHRWATSVLVLFRVGVVDVERFLAIADSSAAMSSKGAPPAGAQPFPGSPSGSEDEQPRGRKRSRTGSFSGGGGVTLGPSIVGRVSPISSASFWFSCSLSCLGGRHDRPSPWMPPGPRRGDPGTVYLLATSPEVGVRPRRGAGALTGDQRVLTVPT